MRLSVMINALRSLHGRQSAPRTTQPFEMILRENVAYLVDEDVRERVWQGFRKGVGTDPRKILACEDLHLCEVIREGGMKPLLRARKVKDAARIALEESAGDLRAVLKLSANAARRILKKFPGIGDPGADKILLFTQARAVPALESNGVRVMARLGLASETDAYAKQYKAATAALARDLPETCPALIEAYQLLRRHGQEICTRSSPMCRDCPLAAKGCPTGRASIARTKRR